MRTRLLYITSPSYSGSTLLTILLAEHPAISTVGELKASAFGDIGSYRCSCGALLAECSFWHDISERVRQVNGKFDLHQWDTHFRSNDGFGSRILASSLKGPAFERVRDLAIRMLPGLARRKATIIEHNAQVIDAVTSATQTRVFVDGSKDPIRARYLMASGRWDYSIVTLIRDGRGFCNSYMRHMSAPMAEAVAEWKALVAEMEHLQQIAGADGVIVRYEDLCTDPLVVINRILHSAALEPMSGIRFPLAPDQRHIFGNAMRLKEITAVVADEKWRTGLSPEDLRLFYAEAGEINERYGYPAE